jgi:hypothetical protein
MIRLKYIFLVIFGSLSGNPFVKYQHVREKEIILQINSTHLKTPVIKIGVIYQ